jgi:hypothetical protein
VSPRVSMGPRRGTSTWSFGGPSTSWGPLRGPEATFQPLAPMTPGEVISGAGHAPPPLCPAMSHDPLPTKTCPVCNREFEWRKKWEDE